MYYASRLAYAKTSIHLLSFISIEQEEALSEVFCYAGFPHKW